MTSRPLPDWAQWSTEPGAPCTIGIEEEVMLLDAGDWSLAYRGDEALPALERELGMRIKGETHAAALELTSSPHSRVADAIAELRELRVALESQLQPLGLRAASAGTHPLAAGGEPPAPTADRYRTIHESMRGLARREPTFALHVHVGVPGPDEAVRLLGALRDRLPLLLALSANSPFWRGVDSGLASVRTPQFQAFPRTGIPRHFRDFEDYVGAIEPLVSAGAIPDPSYMWWDVRVQPRLGTVEVRIMDTQTRLSDTAPLVALVQSVARLELEAGWIGAPPTESPEAIAENRFLAARDGMRAELVRTAASRRVPLTVELERLLELSEPHAAELGCVPELADVRRLAVAGGSARQRAHARSNGVADLPRALAEAFTDPGPAPVPPGDAEPSGRPARAVPA